MPRRTALAVPTPLPHWRRLAIAVAAAVGALALPTLVAPAAAQNPPPAAQEPRPGRSIFDDDFRPTAPAKPTTNPAKPATNAPAAAGPVLDPAAPGPGLVAEAYAGPRFDQPRERRVLRSAEVVLQQPDNPAVGTKADFSARMLGTITVGQAGPYRFAVEGDATTVVTVDGRTVFTRQTGQPAQEAPIDLAAGPHTIRVDLSDITITGPRTRVRLMWGFPGGNLQPVPPAAFTHTGRETSTPNAAAVASTGAPAASPTTTAPSAVATATTKPAVPAKPRPPSDAELIVARSAVRARYASYYADPKPLVQQALAARLLDDATGKSAGNAAPPPAAAAKPSPADQYALLREAADVAANAGDVGTALAAVRAAAAQFAVDEADLTLAALTLAARSSRAAESAAPLAQAAAALAETLLTRGGYDDAAKAVAILEPAVKQVTDATLGPKLKARAAELREVLNEHRRLAPALAKLAADPSDPEANLAVGRFAALLCGNWAAGLPMLARSSDEAMRSLGALERFAPAEEASYVRLGDAWYDRAKAERDPYAARCKLRAADWYERAFAVSTTAATRERAWDRIVEARGWLDLLPLVDPKRDGVRGNWQWAGRDLSCDARGNGLLQLPYRPRGEYDFEVEFTAQAGDLMVHQLMPGGRATFNLMMGGSGSLFDDRSPASAGVKPPVLQKVMSLKPRRRHTALVRVRKGSIQAWVDGQLAADWPADAAAVTGSPDFQLPERAAVGIGAQRTAIVVHAARIIDVGVPQAADPEGRRGEGVTVDWPPPQAGLVPSPGTPGEG